MENLFDIVFKASIYGTIVGLIILLVKRILKGKINPKYNFIIWMLLIVKLILPIGPQSSISLFNKIPISYENQMIENNTGIKEESYVDYNENKSYIGESNVDVDINKSKNIFTTIKSYIPYVWIIGVINIGFVFTISHLIINNKIKKNSKKSSDNINNILIDCKKKINSKSNIEVVVSDIVQTPSLVGVLNPKILLPSSMVSLNNKELEYVFLHELAHYKRKDILSNYILMVLQSIHWFNPTIWYYFKKVREDMEFATDEKVLKILNDDEHKNYGMAILTVLEKVRYSKFTPGLIGMIEDKNSVKRRIENIKNMKFFKNKKIIYTLIGVVIVLSLGSVLLTSAKDNNEKEVDYATSLYEYKNKYIGNFSNTLNIVNELPLSKYYNQIELITEKEPYGLKVFYDINDKDLSKDKIERDLYSSSVILFSLIDNLENTIFNIKSFDKNYTVEYKREDISKMFDTDITGKASTLEGFKDIVTILDINTLSSESLDKVISLAIKNSLTPNYGEEFVAEGHIILDKEEINQEVKVYLIASASTYSFENNIFTSTSGYGAIPMVMTFSKPVLRYTHISTKEPMDGSYYVDSIKDMFPKKLENKVLNADQYMDELIKQQESQANLYLKSINRKANIQVNYVDKKLLEINEDVSNELLEKEELQEYPYWIGSKELLIDGVRYIYETKQIKENGYDIITYSKKNEYKKLIEEYKYKINGNSIEKIK